MTPRHTGSFVLLALACLANAAYADVCRCRKSHAEFWSSPCPVVIDQEPAADAPLTAMYFNLPVEEAFSHLADHANRRLCLGTGVAGDVQYQTPTEQSDTDIAHILARRAGFTADVDQQTIYVHRR